MQRIDTPTAQQDKFGTGKNGFTDGNPQTGTPATDLDSAFFDSVQEEICGVIESTGVALDASQSNQLLTAIKAIITSEAPEIPVTSVNAKTGDVVLTAADVHALPDTYTPPAAPVTSVNGKTGAVSLTYSDVNALPSTYSPDLSAYLTSATASSTYQKINTASKAANGWFKDTNTGVIIQWGYTSNAGAGVTFPIAFPSACQTLTITNAHTRADYCIALNSLTSTGATFYSENNGNMYWLAMGY